MSWKKHLWIIAPLLLIVFIILKVPPLPIYDEWYILGNQFLDSRGPLHPGVLLSPVNEHAIPLARLIFGGNDFGGTSQIRLMVFSVLISCISFLLLQKVFWKKAKPGESFFWALAFFSFSQWEAAFMGMVVHFYLYSLGTVLGVYGFSKKSLPLVLLAILICAGSLSSWPLFVCSLVLGVFFLEIPKSKKFIWVGIILITSLPLKFLLSGGGSAKTLLGDFFANPIITFAYFLNYLGGALFLVSKDPWITGLFGLLGLALVTSFFIKKRKTFPLEFGVLWLHLLFLALVTAMARVQFGASHGSASRYVVLAMPAWFALILVLRQHLRPRLRYVGLILLVAFQFASIRGYTWFVKKKLPDRIAAQACFEQLQIAKDWSSEACDGVFNGVTHSASDMRKTASQLKVSF